MKLQCTHTVDDLPESGLSGRMTYARVANSYHWFILVESGSYIYDDDKRGLVFVPSEPRVTVAFSYVPDATNRYINGKYVPEFTFSERPSDSDLSTLVGYLPSMITKSHVLDTWKLTDEYIALASKPVYQWRFRRFPEFRLYNICCLIPLFGTADCIGYSNHHYRCVPDAEAGAEAGAGAGQDSTFVVVAVVLGALSASFVYYAFYPSEKRTQ